MNDAATKPAGRKWLPELRSRWWTLLLVASVALNLLVGGVFLAHLLRPEGSGGRFSGPSYTQLVPRKFFGDLPSERRRELTSVLRQYREEFRSNRAETQAAALRLADALEAEPFDPARVKQVAEEFAAKGQDLAARGAAVAMEFFAKLTPDERKLLARRIRERSTPRSGKADP